MMQKVPTGGPMWNEPLSEARTNALVAIDAGPITIPDEVIAYIIALELRYHELKGRHNSEFLRSSWEQRASQGQKP